MGRDGERECEEGEWGGMGRGEVVGVGRGG